MTKKQLAEIRARANGATPGPWDHNLGTITRATMLKGKDHKVSVGGILYIPDSIFIAHARTDVPALLDYIEELEESAKYRSH